MSRGSLRALRLPRLQPLSSCVVRRTPVRAGARSWLLPAAAGTFLALYAHFEVLHADQAVSLAHKNALETPSSKSSDDVIEPETSLAYPSTLTPTSSKRSLSLIGLGVRKVSFLRVKVYVVGLYASPEALRAASRLPAWKDFSPESFATGGEELMRQFLDMPYDVALRIVPTRPTDGHHLRDGWARSVTSRTSKRQLSDAESEGLADAMDQLRSVFIHGAVPKGKEITLLRRGTDKALVLEYEGATLGEIRSPLLSTELILAYFASSPISPAAKASCATGFAKALSR